MFRSFFRPFLHDHFLHLLIIIGIGLAFFVPFHIDALNTAVDWNTIITLTGLMMLTKGIELSGYFDVIGHRMITRFRTERQFALFMVSAAALLSTFLTNDVALFILVPLTMTLKKYGPIPASKLIIFEAIAVNAGSLLTPIGNPQNILLWGHSGLSFNAFIGQMLPLTLLLMVGVYLSVWCCFKPKKMAYQQTQTAHQWQPKLVYSCLGLYIIFILALELHLALWGVLIVAAVFAFMAYRVLLSIDWSLLLVFIVMFIDVEMITRLPVLQSMPEIANLNAVNLYLLSIGFSQMISNVPATILLLNYVPSSPLLAFAVNIGGFGILWGSMANIIALRMANDPRIWLRFHYYAIPGLLIAMPLGYWLLTLLA